MRQGHHGAIKRTMRELHERGISCCYATVRRLVSGEQDNARGRKTTQRFANRNINDRVARLPAIDSEAMQQLRTLYPSTVITDIPEGHSVLKSGQHSPKTGGKVLKGKWSGLPLYTLTLEERATCPISCRHLRSC